MSTYNLNVEASSFFPSLQDDVKISTWNNGQICEEEEDVREEDDDEEDEEEEDEEEEKESEDSRDGPHYFI